MVWPQDPTNNLKGSQIAASIWRQWSGFRSGHRAPVPRRWEVRWAPAPKWTQQSGLRSGHSTQNQSHGKAGGHQHQYEHSGQAYGLDTVPKTNHMGWQVGTRINMTIAVRFKVWSQYPVPLTWEGTCVLASIWTQWSGLWPGHSTQHHSHGKAGGHQYQYEHSGQVYGMVTVPQYQSEWNLDRHQHQYEHGG
jgi:hypothetical protein